MNLQISLFGSTQSWNFSDDSGIRSWLQQTPWLEEGGFCILRLGNASEYESFSAKLRHEIMVFNDARSHVRLLHLSDSYTSEPLEQVISSFLGLSNFSERAEMLYEMAIQLKQEPLVLVIPPLEDIRTLAKWMRTTERLIDELRKLDPVGPLCAILFDASSEIEGNFADFDLRAGLPSTKELSVALQLPGESELWSAYMHHRLAWETGGTFLLAREWADEFFSEIPPEDDDTFELQLDEASSQTLHKTPEVIESTTAFLKAALGGYSARSELLSKGLRAGGLWKPPESLWLEIKPWVARAFLQDKRIPEASNLLKSNLVCAPLARFILQRCFDFEARLRAQLPIQVSLLPDDNAQRYFEDFSRTAAKFYPSHTHARPNLPSFFITLGQIQRYLNIPKRKKEAVNLLADLRNAAAHGHYISWASLKALKSISSILL